MDKQLKNIQKKNNKAILFNNSSCNKLNILSYKFLVLILIHYLSSTSSIFAESENLCYSGSNSESCAMNIVAEKPDTNCSKIRLPEIINSFQPVIIPVLTIDGSELYFDRKDYPAGNFFPEKDDIWMSKKAEDGSLQSPQRLSTPFNTDSTDVLFSISPDGLHALVYGLLTDSGGSKKYGFSFLRRFSGNWQYDKPLNIKDFYNLSDYFYGCLSGDGKIIIMSLKRRDSRDSLDLYASFLNDSTWQWSEPLNLGNTINTPLLEGAPYLAYDNRTLYFASNGRNGNERLDLFVTRRLDESWQRWSQTVNLGGCINSSDDENCIWITALGDSAYINSSDTLTQRSGLYKVPIPNNLQPEPYIIISGCIESKLNEMPDSVLLIIRYKEYSESITVEIHQGKYIALLNPKANFNLNIEISGIIKLDTNINFQDITKPVRLIKNFIFDKEEKKSVYLNNFESDQFQYDKPIYTAYFETGSSKVCAADMENIRKAISGLKINNKKKYKIVGYADKRGSEEYNFGLSHRRAESVLQIIKGINAPARKVAIEAKGENFMQSPDTAENRKVEIYLFK